MNEYTELDAMGLAALVRSKEISANELLDEAPTRHTRPERSIVSPLSFPDRSKADR